MLIHYAIYLLIGAFYCVMLASFAAAASSVGAVPLLAFLGCGVLFGVAGPLSVVLFPYARFAATVGLDLLAIWVLPFSLSILFAGDEIYALPIVLGPFLVGGFVLVSSWIRPSPPRSRLPSLARWMLGIPPFAASAAILGMIGYRVISAGAA